MFDQMPDERWERSFQVNFMGSVRLCRAVVPKMAEQGGGTVVITGSDLAKQPEPNFMDYGSCKSALLYLAKALRNTTACATSSGWPMPIGIWRSSRNRLTAASRFNP